MTQDEKYMKQAIKQAKKAYALDEVPIGCVIVAGDKIIARGYNRRNTDKNMILRFRARWLLLKYFRNTVYHL